MKSLYYKRLCGHKNPSEKNSRFVSITFGVIQANMTTLFDNFGTKLLKFFKKKINIIDVGQDCKYTPVFITLVTRKQCFS